MNTQLSARELLHHIHTCHEARTRGSERERWNWILISEISFQIKSQLGVEINIRLPYSGECRVDICYLTTPLLHAAVEKAVEDEEAGAGQQVDEDHAEPGKKYLEFL